MPSGKVHSLATIALAAGAAVVAWRGGYPMETGAALTGGTLVGLFLTPDLDVNNGSISNEWMRKTAGNIIGFIWEIAWKPYSMLIPHRSPLSHFPILGTAIRLAYLAGLIWLVLTLLHLTGVVRAPALPVWWVYAFGGLALSDTAHFVMDHLFRN